MIDWRALLVKYMAEVLDAEGVSFAPSENGYAGFTDEEIEALRGVEAEAVQRAQPRTVPRWS